MTSRILTVLLSAGLLTLAACGGGGGGGAPQQPDARNVSVLFNRAFNQDINAQPVDFNGDEIINNVANNPNAFDRFLNN